VAELKAGKVDELIHFVTARSPELLHFLRVEYNEGGAHHLLEDIEAAFEANTEDFEKMGCDQDARELLLGLVMDRDEFDAVCIHDAVARAGTDELEISEVLCHRHWEEIKGIAMAYKRLYGEDMHSAIKDDISGHLETLYMGIIDNTKCGGGQDQAKKDAERLHDLLIQKFPTQHDAEVAEIFMNRTVHYRHKIYKAYLREYREPLDQDIEKHLTAIMGVSDISIALGLMVKPPHWALANTLYEALEGGKAHSAHHAVNRLFVAQRGRHLITTLRYMVEEYSEGRTVEKYLKAYKGVYGQLLQSIYKYHGKQESQTGC